MWPKIKIFFLSILAGGLWFNGQAAAQGGGLESFSGNSRLREAIWRLAAFIPGDLEERGLKVEGVRGLPPVTITLGFDEVLDPWPESLTLSFVAEESQPPTYFIVSDRRPFGGPNLRLEGPPVKEAGGREADEPAALFLDLLNRLNDRLLARRPRLGPIDWRENAPGFETACVRLLFGARLGPADLFLVRFDPARFTFRPYHESEYPELEQVNIGGWAERLTQAAALINSGQYYPDRSYMGLLSRGGQRLSTAAHPQWKGVLVADPRPEAPEGLPAAAIIDLQKDDVLKAEYYQSAMQSFMLLDREGQIRVRNSHNLAGRAAVGQDQAGRIVLIMTPAAIALHDLALVLKSPALELRQVMGLDGGFESQLLLRQNGTPFLSGGQFSITEQRAVYIPGYHPTLPAILAVLPRNAE
ncbi:MAG: phosphodiester glycosidase family protein [Candidatus Adiutrix sp.]|jgi:uncharacterized protein YigE (DUF2233 family)|nr:phosphodiester glycosidase family protein [Candidatus Adiutrix sp.]